MIERTNPSALAGMPPTRRQMIAGLGVALGGLATGSLALGQAQQKITETQSSGLAGLLTYLHQEIPIKATPQRIYEALLDSKQFAAFTGLAAEIDPKAGGSFSMFGGLIVGRNIELVADQRIVQAWRPANWDPGVYSIVKFELKTRGSGATVVLDHTGFPEGDFGHLNPGWYERYWEPLKKFLA
jgi:activator of HSP90 ATPase